eukprot:5190159-Prymnesium_polylepis.1
MQVRVGSASVASRPYGARALEVTRGGHVDVTRGHGEVTWRSRVEVTWRSRVEVTWRSHTVAGCPRPHSSYHCAGVDYSRRIGL